MAAGDPAERAAGKLTLNVFRDELTRVVRQRSADDAHLHYLDGRELYGDEDFAKLPLPDGLYPDAATHRRIGERFAALAFGPDGSFTEWVTRRSGSGGHDHHRTDRQRQHRRHRGTAGGGRGP